MTSDGFSVKTTVSQLANVARTQAKGQAAQPVNPATEKLLKQDQRVDRVKRNEEVQKQKIDPEHKRRHGTKDHPDPQHRDAAADDERETGTGLDEGEDAGKGVVLDTKA